MEYLRFFFILTISFSVNSQTCTLKQISEEVVKVTVDAERLNVMRSILSADLLEIEKTGFAKACDSIENIYFAQYEYFYSKEYTKEELTSLLEFYKTQLGSKVASDIRQLYQNNLPSSNPLYERLVQIRKNFRKSDQIERTKFNEGEEKKANSEVLLSILSVKAYLEAIRTEEIMNVEPKDEDSLIKAFDAMRNVYLIDLIEYFQSNYTHDEINEVLLFYRSPLGQEVADNNIKLIDVASKANGEWANNIQQIMHDISFGKYQREHFKQKKK